MLARFITFFATTTLVLADTDNLITYKVPISDSFKEFLGYPEDLIFNFTQVTTKYGYDVQEHLITTEDGYVLTNFRMRSPNCSTFKEVPVILLHGSFVSADGWLVPGPGIGLPYLIADDCYDLWVCSTRGSNYGRNHTTLNPDKDAAFWKYSGDEYGIYDVPAYVDYVINVTGAEQVNFIGYSQAGTSGVIALIEREEYNDKIKLNIGLAPAINMPNTESLIFNSITVGSLNLKPLLDIIGIREVFFRKSILQVVLEFICQLPYTENICRGIFTLLDSSDPGSISDYSAKLVASRFPSGCSVQQLAGFGQNHITGVFKKFDFGETENLAKYNSSTPPLYDLRKAVAPAVFIAGANDKIVNAKDVADVAANMPNLVEYIEIPDAWNHVDMIYGQRIPTVLYPIISKYLNQYSTSK